MSQINKIGVIGAGNMGSGIAQKIAQEGLNVVIVDIRDEYVKRGLGIIKQLLGEGLERKIFTTGQVEEIFSRITGTTDFSAVADADLVIEAVFEDKQVKSDLFKKLDQLCAEKMCVSSPNRRPDPTVSLVSIISTTPRKTGF
jgi:enoyl-CoA hydratase/3-hydroxyacyl-CoA dehydrogenase